MSTEELERLSVVCKIVDKRLTQVTAAQQLSVNSKASKTFSKKIA